MTFRNLSTKMYLPDLDNEILDLWKERDVFKRSIESKSTDDNYIFYDVLSFRNRTATLWSLGGVDLERYRSKILDDAWKVSGAPVWLGYPRSSD